MVLAGADRLCFVISPGKSDILAYYGGRLWGADIAYVVQPSARGLCDAIFCAAPLVDATDSVLIGLPDTIWTPRDGMAILPKDVLSFLLFFVERPELFDAVVTDASGAVVAIDVKQQRKRTSWIWGAIRMPGVIFHQLHDLWCRPERQDEYLGSLINAWLAEGGSARGVRYGDAYVDVGTLHGYRAALRLLESQAIKTG